MASVSRLVLTLPPLCFMKHAIAPKCTHRAFSSPPAPQQPPFFGSMQKKITRQCDSSSTSCSSLSWSSFRSCCPSAQQDRCCQEQRVSVASQSAKQTRNKHERHEVCNACCNGSHHKHEEARPPPRHVGELGLHTSPSEHALINSHTTVAYLQCTQHKQRNTSQHTRKREARICLVLEVHAAKRNVCCKCECVR